MNELISNTETLPERIAALRSRAALETVEIWQPEPGELLAGEYVGHRDIEHPRFGKQWQLMLKDESGNVYAVWLNNWLRQNLKAQNLAIGDLVCISYLGKKRTSQGSEYNGYSLAVEKS